MVREGLDVPGRSGYATRSRAVVTAAVVGVALVLAACGGNDAETEEDRVRATIDGLHEDIATGDMAGVCAAMSERPKRQIGMVGHGRRPTTCERDLRELVEDMAAMTSFGEELPPLRRSPRPEVVGVEIAGDRAVARTALGGKPLDVPLVRESGEWKLNDFFVVTGPVRPDLQ